MLLKQNITDVERKAFYGGLLSPDGSWWLVGSRNGDMSLYSRDLNQRFLISNTANISNIVWGKDSQTIYFTRDKEEDFSSAVESQNLFNDKTKVLVAPEKGVAIANLAVSPNQRFVAYTRFDTASTIIGKSFSLIVFDMQNRVYSAVEGYSPSNDSYSNQWGDDSTLYFIGEPNKTRLRGLFKVSLPHVQAPQIVAKDVANYQLSPSGEYIALQQSSAVLEVRKTVTVISNSGKVLSSIVKDSLLPRMLWSSNSNFVYFSYIVFNKGGEISRLDARNGKSSIVIPRMRLGQGIARLIALSRGTLVFQKYAPVRKINIVEVKVS